MFYDRYHPSKSVVAQCPALSCGGAFPGVRVELSSHVRALSSLTVQSQAMSPGPDTFLPIHLALTPLLKKW